MRLPAFYAWLVVDKEGTYPPTIHATRKDAKRECKSWAFLRDAQWRIVRVRVSPMNKRHSNADQT